MATSHILARTAITDVILNGLRRHNLAENAPTHRQPILCAECGQRADIWHEDITPLCGRCYLVVIGDDDEVQL